MICSSCSPSKCNDIAREGEPLQVACPTCNENGCLRCDDKGYFELEGCPQEYIGAKMQRFVTYADHAKRGSMPKSGGVLDQTNWFVHAVQFLESEEERVKAETYK